MKCEPITWFNTRPEEARMPMIEIYSDKLFPIYMYMLTFKLADIMVISLW